MRVGQCEWHPYTKKDGSLIKLQGTWELAFAKWADEQGLTFDTHRGRLPYTDTDGNERSYYPDFYIYEWDCYIDVKNNYHLELQKDKFDCIRKCNPNVEIRILTKADLEELGVVLV